MKMTAEEMLDIGEKIRSDMADCIVNFLKDNQHLSNKETHFIVMIAASSLLSHLAYCSFSKNPESGQMIRFINQIAKFARDTAKSMRLNND